MLNKAILAIVLVVPYAGAAQAQPVPSRVTEATTACVIPRALRALINPQEARRSNRAWVRYVVADGQCGRVAADIPTMTWGVVDGLTDIEVPRGSGRRVWVVSSSVTADHTPQPGSAGVIVGEPVQNWTAIERGAGPNALCGLTGSIGDGTLSMMAAADQPGLISLVVRHPAWRFPTGGRVAVTTTFSDRVSMTFNGRTQGDGVEIALTDDLRQWTHEFTAASSAAITFPATGGSRWNVSLASTTPATTAMAKCVEADPAIIVPPPFGPVTTPIIPPAVADQLPANPPALKDFGSDKFGTTDTELPGGASSAPVGPAPIKKRDAEQSPGDAVIARWSGDSMMTTRPFRVDGPWELRWTTDAGYFSIKLIEVGSDRDMLIANQSTGGSSSAYHSSGGTFYLEITGSKPWSIQAFSVSDDTSASKSVQATAPLPAPPPLRTAPTTVSSGSTDLEPQLIDIVTRYAGVYESAPNDMLKGASRPARGKALCALLPRLAVSNWTGEIYKLSSIGDGNGVVELRIAKDVYVTTWNNALSDIGDRTLIGPETTLFRNVSSLAKGQKVRFSGEFIRADVDCLKESSLSVNGAMTEPEYIFRFSDIQPVN